MECMESDLLIEKWVQENDSTFMPLPDIEFEPHLLISKVRKHYMEHVIKLLALNYENNQRLLNKNIYLPSAIWRCAKFIEMTAAQSSMVVNLYRRNIATVISQIKADTKRGKLNRKLFECLKQPPKNEMKTQTNLIMGKDCTCICTCHQRKKVRKESPPLKNYGNITLSDHTTNDAKAADIHINPIASTQINNAMIRKEHQSLSLESHDADEVMLQLEKLFEGGSNDDDIFDGMFSNTIDITFDDSFKKPQSDNCNDNTTVHGKDLIIEKHAAQLKSLDERLVSLSGIIGQDTAPVDSTKTETLTNKNKRITNKWICEEYFLKRKLFELLDQMRDCNRAKLIRLKELLIDLFGDDSDDEGVVSPIDESPEFVTSCKERIAPWVVKLLTPYYIKGRIRGKALFKSLAKHLIRLIYQCSKYPEQYEVKDFVQDFLHNHKLIRCEADFKEFRIENI
ncbi:unnamed protein product [Leptosia nina]|uniref:Set2 Rpb1 interacting domain-containing protein n=1 Tax=Leptosia nina TaxID=320188 RepID=A0AAV1J8D6_9NEOP